MEQNIRPALGETLDNQRIMKLVEEALGRPEPARREFLQQECASNSDDFDQAWHYVEWEQRMQGFLLEPAIAREDVELRLVAGDVLEDRFRIIGEVAQGGMGVVYEAHDQKLGRRIALKVAKTGFGNELPPEVRNATEVSHPNVCKLFEIHTARVRQRIVDFITMEYLEGETLASRLQRGKIPEHEAFAIARQLAAGVAEAHRNHVIHGDIKSNNVILTKMADGTPRAVITDFGLARKQGAESRGIWGTPGYMAPELWRGEEPSVRSDLYALGVVFFEMATGEIPSQVNTSKPATGRLKATPWYEVASRKPPAVNAAWDGVLSRCLDPDSNRRYASADVLALALAPKNTRRNLLIAAAVALSVVLTGVLTYKSATAPTDTVRLAVLPVESVGADTLANPEREIARLEGTRNKGFALLRSVKASQATHLLRVTLARMGTDAVVHAVLTDAHSQAPLKTWDAHYSQEQLKYVPKALAGVVSGALHLPPLAETRGTNALAQNEYTAGIEAIRLDDTIDQGIAKLEKAAGKDPDAAVVFASLAEADWMKRILTGDDTWLERSREASRQAELRYPDTGTGHRAAGLLHVSAGRFEEAEAELLRAVELEPTIAENFRRLAFVYQQNNQDEQALIALRKAVDLQPNYYKNQYNLGYFFLHQARYREAAEHLEETVKLTPSNLTARFNLAMAYTDTGRFEDARGQINYLLQHGKNDSARFQLAKILMYEGKDREALPDLQEAVQESPSDYVYLVHLGIAQRRIGLRAEGLATMRKAMALAERKLVVNARDAATRAFLGYYCAQLGQRGRAESEAAQAIQLAPKGQDVIWMTVMTYEALGKRDEAIAILKSAPVEMLGDLKRWPDVADLTADPRFIELTAGNAANKEMRK